MTKAASGKRTHARTATKDDPAPLRAPTKSRNAQQAKRGSGTATRKAPGSGPQPTAKRANATVPIPPAAGQPELVHRHERVSVWAITGLERPQLESIIGPFPPRDLVETGTDDNPLEPEHLYWHWNECRATESFYGRALHALRDLDLDEELPGTFVLYDHVWTADPGLVQGHEGLFFLGDFPFLDHAKPIGTRLEEDEGCISVWVWDATAALGFDEFVGRFDEDRGETTGGWMASVADHLASLASSAQWLGPASAAAASLGLQRVEGAFALRGARYLHAPKELPHATGVYFLGTFAVRHDRASFQL